MLPRNAQKAALTSVAVWIIVLAGCEGDQRFPKGAQSFFPVKGTVILSDAPLSGGTIRFTSEDPNFVASSPIGTDGSFSLQTSISQPARSIPGVPGGVYKATIIMPAEGKSPPRIVTAPEEFVIKYGGQEDLTVKLP